MLKIDLSHVRHTKFQPLVRCFPSTPILQRDSDAEGVDDSMVRATTGGRERPRLAKLIKPGEAFDVAFSILEEMAIAIVNQGGIHSNTVQP